MKSLRQLCAVLILTFALSAGAFAGQVNCPGLTQQSAPETLTPAGGDQPHNNIQTSNSTNDGGTTNTVAGNVLANVLSLILALI